MMELPKRTLAKALSWQAIGLFSMTFIGYLVTGSLASGGALAGFSMITSFFVYMAHERIWSRIAWGRAGGGGRADATGATHPR